MYFEPIPKKFYTKKVFEADWLFIEETIDDSDFEQGKGARGLLLSLYKPGLDT